ncbi:MAG: AAA family ATPase, partial [Acidimicrobiales bacterium]
IGGIKQYSPLRDALRSVRSYAIYPDSLREPSKPSPLAYLDTTGTNWASIVRGVAAGSYGGELRAALAQVTGDVIDLRVDQLGDNLAVLFRHRVDAGDRRGGAWFDAGRESDGTLRIAGLLTALLQEPPLTLIAVEEPELTIHPGAIPLVVDFLRMAASWSQVLITTHSPELLDMIAPEEIRVVQRIAGVTTVSPVDAGQVGLVRAQLATPGELLRREGLAPQTQAPQTQAPQTQAPRDQAE